MFPISATIRRRTITSIAFASAVSVAITAFPARTAAAQTARLLQSEAQSSPAQSAASQSPAANQRKLEFRITSGALIGTGTGRNEIKDARATAAQLAWTASPSFVVTGTFGWSRSRDITSADAPKLDVFNSDIGVELRTPVLGAGRMLSFSPFAGLGAGARSYNYRNLDVDATHNLAGYAALGGELGIGRVGLRVEAREYVSGFKPLVGAGSSHTRNDMLMTLGVRFNRKRASEVR